MIARARFLIVCLIVGLLFPSLATASPYFSLSTDKTFLPGEKATVHLYTRDVPALEFRLYRVNDPALFFENLRDIHGFGAGHYGPKEQIEEKGILPDNSYNIDETGFRIGVEKSVDRYY